MSENRKGDTDHLETLFRQHYKLVYCTAYSKTGSRDDAEDVLQTVFMRLLENPLNPEATRNLKGYLYKAALNQSLLIARARQRQRPIEDAADVEAGGEFALPRSEERTRDLRRDAIAKLTEEQVELVRLHYECGYTYDEIAELLGISSFNVAITMFRTRARLKKLMRQAAAEAARLESTHDRYGGSVASQGELR